ncbi:MAG: hypothetical protein IPK03_07430 [Bacteroidetes bacterium]|nr:hypothetical protein [Bacteroidota bacterium]
MKPALYILLLFGFLQTSSQQLKFSGEYKVSGRVEKAQILGKTSAGYIIRKMGDQEVLELYSSNLNFIKSKTVVVGNQQVIRAEIVGDNIIFYCLNMDERKAYLNAVVVNSDLTHSSIRKEIDSFDLNEDEKSKNFKVTSSQGALLTAIVHVKEQDEDLKSIRVDVLNLNAEVEYRREINIVSEAAYRKVLRKTMLDNEGNAYLIVEKNRGVSLNQMMQGRLPLIWFQRTMKRLAAIFISIRRSSIIPKLYLTIRIRKLFLPVL